MFEADIPSCFLLSSIIYLFDTMMLQLFSCFPPASFFLSHVSHTVFMTYSCFQVRPCFHLRKYIFVVFYSREQPLVWCSSFTHVRAIHAGLFFLYLQQQPPLRQPTAQKEQAAFICHSESLFSRQFHGSVVVLLSLRLCCCYRVSCCYFVCLYVA